MAITFDRFTQKTPVVPYIRLADYAVRQPWYIPERKLLDYLLVYIQEGECLFEVEKKAYTLKNGDICLVQPNMLLTLRGTSPTITPFVHFDIFYHPDRERSFPTKPGQIDLTAYAGLMQPRLNDFTDVNVPVLVQPPYPQQFKDRLLKMIGLWLSGKPYSMLEAQSIGTGLVLSILQTYGMTGEHSTSAPQELNWITSYFSFHLSEQIQVKDMARRANMSSSGFTKLFLKTFGVSPYQYLMNLRLTHAEELLRNTDLKLYQIAEYCGFANEQHLSKTFRKTYGVTPGSLRNRPPTP